MSTDTSQQQLLNVFLGKAILIDVRSPVEFEKSHLPGSINLPILDNKQRAEVGTTYRTKGKEAAIALGHTLVAGELKAQRVKAWLNVIKTNVPCVITCARGGLRSQIAQKWLCEEGAEVEKVAGGYKAIRRFLSETLEELSKVHPLIVVAGYTGSGKTDLLQNFRRAGLSVLDLEGLASHRGSAFGEIDGPQPQQATFENAVAVEVIKLCSRSRDPIFVESESGSIGRVWIPKCLYNAMQKSQNIVLECNMEERIERIIKDYIIDVLQRVYANSFDALELSLIASLARIQKRLGGLRHSEIKTMIETAVEEHRNGADPNVHSEWIRQILEQYYDAFYSDHLAKNKARTIVQGNAEKLFHFFTRVNHASLEISDEELRQISQLNIQ